jgi:hypothetical protein
MSWSNVCEMHWGVIIFDVSDNQTEDTVFGLGTLRFAQTITRARSE